MEAKHSRDDMESKDSYVPDAKRERYDDVEVEVIRPARAPSKPTTLFDEWAQQDAKYNDVHRAAVEARSRQLGVREVVAPPGPLRVVILDSTRGPRVGQLREGSPILDTVLPGELILRIDDEDVTRLSCDAVAAMLIKRADGQRKLLIAPWDARAGGSSVRRPSYGKVDVTFGAVVAPKMHPNPSVCSDIGDNDL